MKLRSIKYEFSTMRKEAHEVVTDEVVSSVRLYVGKVLQLNRPKKIKDLILSYIQPIFNPNDHRANTDQQG